MGHKQSKSDSRGPPEPAEETQSEKYAHAQQILAKFNQKGHDYDQDKVSKLAAEFVTCDVWQKESIQGSDVPRLLKRLLTQADPKEVEGFVKYVDTNKDGAITFPEFVQLYYLLEDFPELENAFRAFADQPTHMSPEALRRFLCQQQVFCPEEMEATLTEVKSMSYDPNVILPRHFYQLVTRKENEWISPTCHEVWQQMDCPMTDYFIYSSHNTYLEGNQFSSNSSAEMYKRALLQGCRCVELDCWDGPDDDPLIYHGHTVTSKIRFQEAVEAIKETAFQTSPYPVILSLEVHCGLKQQQQMAVYMKDIFGSALKLPDLDMSVDKSEFSPDGLKHRILVKGKVLPRNLDGMDDSDDDTDYLEQTDSGNAPAMNRRQATVRFDSDPTGVSPRERLQEKALSRLHLIKPEYGPEVLGNASDLSHQSRPPRRRKSLPKVHPALSEITWMMAVKCKNIKKRLDVAMPYEVTSFDEDKGMELCKNSLSDLRLLNRKCFSRIYPGKSRVNSSNFPIAPFFEAGCQMVALNIQSDDLPLWQLRSYFAANGNCGYILKPRHLVRDIDGPPKELLNIDIISGRRLAEGKRPLAGTAYPFVEVICDGPNGKQIRTTFPAATNAENPVWQEGFAFDIVDRHVTTITLLLKTKAKDSGSGSSSSVVAVNGAVISSLRPGYRVMPLFNKGGVIPNAYLLLRILITKAPGDCPPPRPISHSRQTSQPSASFSAPRPTPIGMPPPPPPPSRPVPTPLPSVLDFITPEPLGQASADPPADVRPPTPTKQLHHSAREYQSPYRYFPESLSDGSIAYGHLRQMEPREIYAMPTPAFESPREVLASRRAQSLTPAGPRISPLSSSVGPPGIRSPAFGHGPSTPRTANMGLGPSTPRSHSPRLGPISPRTHQGYGPALHPINPPIRYPSEPIVPPLNLGHGTPRNHSPATGLLSPASTRSLSYYDSPRSYYDYVEAGARGPVHPASSRNETPR